MKSTLLLLVAIVTFSRAQTINECLMNDSISCIQKTLFRKAKEFFNKDSFEIITGVSLVTGKDGRESRSGKELIYEQRIEKSDNIVERQDALEKFIGEKMSDFIKGRTLKINFMPIIEKIGSTARAITELIPKEIRQATDDVVEGRGKKKYFKHMLPLMIAAKAKFGILAAIAYFTIAILAKKAILAAAVSVVISIMLGLKSFHIEPVRHEHHEHLKKYDDHHYQGSSLSPNWSPPASSSGWSAGAGWDDTHGTHSGQTRAYSAHNH